MHLEMVRCHSTVNKILLWQGLRPLPAVLTAVHEAAPQGHCFSLLLALRWLDGFFLQGEYRI